MIYGLVRRFLACASRRLRASGRGIAGGAMTLLFAVPGIAYAATNAASCENLAKHALPHATITLAQTVEAGQFQVPKQGMGFNSGLDPAGHLQQGSNPVFCRIAATLKPAADSDIRIEVWLPRSGWNGKFLALGNFGWGGSIMYPWLLSGLQEGYAVANTDTGHQEGNGRFTVGHPEKLIDYAWRADHEMTVTAKALIKSFYGKAPAKSYWIGCSLGGLEGLVEAKRFPADYDGIVAGAPPNPLVNFNAAQMWPNWLISQDPSRQIPREKYAMIHQSAVKRCGSAVGQEDNLVDQPDKCDFDPKSLLCAGADAPDCLTAAQLFLLQQIYRGPVDPRTGKVIFPGPALGSELELAPFASGRPFTNAVDLFRYPAFENPDWDEKTMNWDKDIVAATAKLGPLLHVDADLKAFFRRGGKLMMYVGWNDYHNPQELIGYYKSLISTAGEKSRDQIRLFTIPGMGHCGGGQGCDSFDKLSAIDLWAAKGLAPDRIVAAKAADGKIIRSRPLCAYPKVARYSGSSDTKDAANFNCVPG